MSTDTNWIEEAKARAASKRSAREARFVTEKDDKITDPDIVVLPVNSLVEGVILAVSYIDGQYGATPIATIDDAEHGPLRVLMGGKILGDLMSEAEVGWFVSIEWKGMKPTKDGSTEYRNYNVAVDPPPDTPPRPDPVAASANVTPMTTVEDSEEVDDGL